MSNFSTTLTAIKTALESLKHEKFVHTMEEASGYSSPNLHNVYIMEDHIVLFQLQYDESLCLEHVEFFDKTPEVIESLVRSLDLMSVDATTEDYFYADEPIFELVERFAELSPESSFAKTYQAYKKEKELEEDGFEEDQDEDNPPRDFSSSFYLMMGALDAEQPKKFELEDVDNSGERNIVYILESNTLLFHLPEQASERSEQIYSYTNDEEGITKLVRNHDLMFFEGDAALWTKYPTYTSLAAHLVAIAPDSDLADDYHDYRHLATNT